MARSALVQSDDRLGQTGVTLGTQIAGRLERAIVEHGWPVGHLIGSEAELTKRFGVGVAAVREAARILQARGMAQSRRGPGGGLFVTAPERSLVTDAARRYLEHVGVARADLFEVWLALGQVAVANVAATLDTEGARRLRAALAEEADLRAVRSWADTPNIHLEIAKLSGNRALELFIEMLTDLSLSVYAPFTDHRRVASWLHARHVEIVDSVIAGDVPMAQFYLRRYIDRVKRSEPTDSHTVLEE